MASTRTEPNPYLDMELSRLAMACNRIVHEIDRPGARSAADRARLALRCRQLLLAIAIRISPTTATIGSPEYEVAHGRMATEAFGNWYGQKRTLLRSEALSKAADVVLGADPRRWMHARTEEDRIPYYAALESDAGLQWALSVLDSNRRPTST